jgi:O-antigen ligase
MPDPCGRAIIWRSLPLRLAIVAIPAWLTLGLLLFNVSWGFKVVIGTVLAVTLAAPAHGLLLVAVLAPLGQFLARFVGAGHFRIAEAIVVCFLAGWLLRGVSGRDGPRMPAPLIAWMFAAAVVSSIAGLAWKMHAYPGELARTAADFVFGYYMTADRVGLAAGARLLEGLALVAATVTLFRERPRLAVTLPIALTVAATLAAGSSLLLWWGIAPADVLARYARIGYRVSAHVADVNAAGSYFAMALCLVLGMAARSRRRARVLWLMAAIAPALGLWFSESRTAIGITVLVLGFTVAWELTSSWRSTTRAIALVSVLVAAFAMGSVRAYFLERDPTYRGAGFRTQFNATSVRMMAARPLFGVGVGQYYVTSPLFLSPQLAWTYGYENAHNYFMQLGAELGISGLAMFAAWLAVVLWIAIRALGRARRDRRLLGATDGVIVMLGTCLTSHPLLVDEVAFPFWIQLGLVAGLAGSAAWNARAAAEAAFASVRARRPIPLRLIAAGSAVCVLLSGPVIAARRNIEPTVSQSVDGFYGWETTADGRRFRWTAGYASLFVPADVTEVYIPVRLPTDRPAIAPIGVEIAVSGVKQGRTWVGSSWMLIPVRLPAAMPPARLKRIDLQVDRTWQPALYIAGSPDMRSVGVQVGECQLVR